MTVSACHLSRMECTYTARKSGKKKKLAVGTSIKKERDGNRIQHLSGEVALSCCNVLLTCRSSFLVCPVVICKHYYNLRTLHNVSKNSKSLLAGRPYYLLTGI